MALIPPPSRCGAPLLEGSQRTGPYVNPVGLPRHPLRRRRVHFCPLLILLLLSFAPSLHLDRQTPNVCIASSTAPHLLPLSSSHSAILSILWPSGDLRCPLARKPQMSVYRFIFRPCHVPPHASNISHTHPHARTHAHTVQILNRAYTLAMLYSEMKTEIEVQTTPRKGNVKKERKKRPVIQLFPPFLSSFPLFLSSPEVPGQFTRDSCLDTPTPFATRVLSALVTIRAHHTRPRKVVLNWPGEGGGERGNTTLFIPLFYLAAFWLPKPCSR